MQKWQDAFTEEHRQDALWYGLEAMSEPGRCLCCDQATPDWCISAGGYVCGPDCLRSLETQRALEQIRHYNAYRNDRKGSAWAKVQDTQCQEYTSPQG